MMNTFVATNHWSALREMSLAVSQFTVEQFARRHGKPVSSSLRTLRRLEHAGLAEAIQIRTRKVPPVTGPFYRWYPGQPAPDFGELSYYAKQRHQHLSPEIITAFVASKLTLRQFNVRRNSKPKRTHQTHEYGLTQTYIYAAHRWPQLIQTCWRNEVTFAASRGFREKVEDAHIVHPKTRQPMLAWEYVGQYPPQRLRELHDAFVQRVIPYFLF